MYYLYSNNAQFEENTKKPKSFPFKFYVFSVILCIFLYISLSYILIHDYHDALFKTDKFWDDFQNKSRGKYLNKLNCTKASSFNSSSLAELKHFIEFINVNTNFHYFLCFSSLYFAVKVEKYDVFRSVLNSNGFNVSNEFYYHKNRDYCVMEEKYGSSSHDVNLHLCNVKQNQVKLCSWFKEFSSSLNCTQNGFNGEYVVDLNKNIKLTFHEFKLRFKKNDDVWELFKNKKYVSKTPNEFLEENARMEMGAYDVLSGGGLFNVPIYFYYNHENRIKRNFNFLNYLNTPIRLPSEVVDYLMMFYPNTWYL